MRKSLILLGLVTAGCAATLGSQPAPPHAMTHMAMGKAVSASIARTATTISGQPLRLPQGPSEMVASSLDIPAGGATAIHQHPWSRFVYVERGPVQIINHDTNQSTDLQTGQVIAEVVAQWHEARASANVPARIIVIDLVPPGASNMVMKPAA